MSFSRGASCCVAALVLGCGSSSSSNPADAGDAKVNDAPTASDAPLEAASQDVVSEVSTDVVALDSPSDGSAAFALHYEDTNDGIRPFLTFDSSATPATAAPHATFVWGADLAHVPMYRASTNPGIVLSSYIPFTRDPDATHTLAYWKGMHPDWVVYQC